MNYQELIERLRDTNKHTFALWFDASDAIESLLAENERLRVEPAKYRDSPKYGCHCDLEDHMEPDGCVIDIGNLNDCVYAKRYKSKEQCQYWRTIQIVKPGE